MPSYHHVTWQLDLSIRLVRFPDSSTTPMLLVSPPRWSVPKPLTTLLLKHCTSHLGHCSSPNCLLNFNASPSISPLQTVFSPLSHLKSNPATLRICPPLTVMVGTWPLLDMPSNIHFWSRLPARPLIPTFLWNLCERSFYITLN